MGKVPEHTLLQGGQTDGPQTYEKMLSITSHRNMQIKTTMRYHFTPISEWPSLTNQQTSAGKDVEKREP